MRPTADQLLAHYGLDEALSLEWCSIITGVRPERIRQWKARGRIEPADTDDFGRPMYRPVDVLRAERDAAANGVRTRAQIVAPRRPAAGS